MKTEQEVFDEYVAKLEKIYNNRTAGDHTFTGFLAAFQRAMNAAKSS